MAANFSGAVRISDFNDFIAPSQECVVNLDGSKALTLPDMKDTDGEVLIQSRAPQGFQQTTGGGEQPIKVTLTDCLACSGCVTSAETVLMEVQSSSAFLAQCGRPDITVIVSISPQSVASLAALYDLTPQQCLGRITHCLKRFLNVKHVFDTSETRELSLLHASQEFLLRLRAAESSSHAPGTKQSLPMLASACPGWVCYAEKTHGDYVLPYISETKSPQAVMGSLLKRSWCEAAGLDPAAVYHVSVAPCYDKKLEASREDFWLPGTQIPEVDSVLTTNELRGLLADAADLRSMPEEACDSLIAPPVPAPQPETATTPPLLDPATPSSLELPSTSATGGAVAAASASREPCAAAEASSSTCPPRGSPSPPHSGSPAAQLPSPPVASSSGGGGSGGYAEHVFRAAALVLHGVTLPPGPLPWTTLRNADMRELTLEVEGAVVLRVAAAYGFRNIQTVLRKIKRKVCEYHFVEVMACPGGCLNGAGQVAPGEIQAARQGVATGAETLAVVSGAYHGADPQYRAPDEHSALRRTTANEVLTTQYHKREKTITSTIADW